MPGQVDGTPESDQPIDTITQAESGADDMPSDPIPVPVARILRRGEVTDLPDEVTTWDLFASWPRRTVWSWQSRYQRRSVAVPRRRPGR